MSSISQQNMIQQTPYLRVQRNFPGENPQALSIEIDRAYTDTAAKVNARVIGIFPLNRQSVTGEQWFLNQEGGTTAKQQSLRQVYQFSATGNIAHGLSWTSVSQINPKSYGSFTDGTNWYGVPFAGSVAIAGQVTFYVTSSNIVVQAGAAAPTISSGVIVLEWLSQT